MKPQLTLPARAKRTQRIGAAPDARTPMLMDLAKRQRALAILERLASMPLYCDVANAAHSINTYTETASVGTDYEPSLTFYLYLSQLNRWTDDRYVQALALVEEAMAYHAPQRTDKEFPDSHNRSHRFAVTLPTGDADMPTVRLEVVLDCYENKETAECRRVQVGTRMVEEPIYRMDCVAPEGHAGELPAPVLALDGLL